MSTGDNETGRQTRTASNPKNGGCNYASINNEQMKKGFFLLLVILLSCQENKKAQKVEEFWNWFIINKPEFKTNNWDETNETLDSIHHRLIRIDKNVRIVFWKTSKGVTHLNFTAQGHEDSFETVELIMSRAPKFNDIEFSGFISRSTANKISVNYKDTTISNEDVFFSYEDVPNSKRIDVVLYSKNFENNIEFKHSVFSLMTDIVGEKDGVIFINKLNYHSINDTVNHKVFKLKLITEIIDKKK